MPSAGRLTRSRPTSRSMGSKAGRCTPCSSARRGSSRSAPRRRRSRRSPRVPPPVRLSWFARDNCWPRRSTRSWRVTDGCTRTSATWWAIRVDERPRDERTHMSGHSKWATTKHKKAVVDAKRGKLFAKLIKNIEVAARTGGGDPAGNPTLYDAIQKAKKSSVPNENIDRAVRRGAGLEAGGASYETVTYEGYAPGGVAVLVECLTDNRNRAAADVRTALTRNGGSMADPGSVSYLFARKGVVIVGKAPGVTEDDVLTAVLDAGAEEVNDLGESFEVVSEATDLIAVRSALQQAGVDYESAEVAFLPTVEVPLDEENAKKVFRLLDVLEDSDDVQNGRASCRER